MFGRKKDDIEEAKMDADLEQPEPPEEDASASLSLRSRTRERTPISPPVPASVARPEPVRRPPDIHSATGRPVGRLDNESKKLIVGPEIVLDGQIKSCDKLVVGGWVEANMIDCGEIEIAETGTFKGEAEIDTADISGTFEGSLTVRKLLIVRASGRITGTIRFGEIEVERGGQIIGDVQVCLPVEAREPLPIHTAQTPAE